MESATSAVNWQPVNVAKRPGELLVDSLRHVARGADGVGFFQWRASRAGGEKYHSALVPHAGPDSARFREVVALGAALTGDRARWRARRVAADVALLWDWNAWWACDLDSHPSGELRYVDAPQRWHRALTELGATVDVVHPSADLSGYRLVVVPTLYLCSDALAPALEGVRGARRARARHLLLGHRRRARPRPARRLPGRVPGAARRAGRGVRAAAARLRSRSTTAAGADLWTEVLTVTDAEAVASHADGTPAVTRNGSAWYVATRLDEAATATLAERVARRRGCAARGGRAGGRRDRPQGPVPVRAQRRRLPRRGARRTAPIC